MTRAIFYELNITTWPAVKVHLFIWNSLWCSLYWCMTHTAETTAAGDSLQISSSSRCIINQMMCLFILLEKISSMRAQREEETNRKLNTFECGHFYVFSLGAFTEKCWIFFWKPKNWEQDQLIVTFRSNQASLNMCKADTQAGAVIVNSLWQWVTIKHFKNQIWSLFF